jgi:hypothetical protein
VHTALHLDLNQEFEGRGDGIKYFVVVVVLIYALSLAIGL